MLCQLYDIRNKSGSIVLPPAPKPQIKWIYMRVPIGRHNQSKWYLGARDFWRGELESLKYWNPDLRVKVDEVQPGDNKPFWLTVGYEAPSREDLVQLKEKPLPVPYQRIPLKRLTLPRGYKEINPSKIVRLEKDGKERWERIENNVAGQPPKEQTPHFVKAAYTYFKRKKALRYARQMGQAPPAPPPYQRYSFHRARRTFRRNAPKNIKRIMGLRQIFFLGSRRMKMSRMRPVRMTANIVKHAPKDTIQAKGMKSVNGELQTIYGRTITTPLAGVRHTELWNWIRQHQGLPDHRKIPQEEEDRHKQYLRFGKQAHKDRILVRKGVGAKKKEEKELRKAREAAERNAADTV